MRIEKREEGGKREKERGGRGAGVGEKKSTRMLLQITHAAVDAANRAVRILLRERHVPHEHLVRGHRHYLAFLRGQRRIYSSYEDVAFHT